MSILDVVPESVARRIFATVANDQARSSSAEGPLEASQLNKGKKDKIERRSEKVVENESLIQGVENILEVFDDSYMNKHLMFSIVELLFIRLVPELIEKTPEELLEERGVDILGWQHWSDGVAGAE